MRTRSVAVERDGEVVDAKLGHRDAPRQRTMCCGAIVTTCDDGRLTGSR